MSETYFFFNDNIFTDTVYQYGACVYTACNTYTTYKSGMHRQ